MSASLPDSSRRVLVVLRHAKAEPYGAEDHARRLTERGLRQAAEVGGWLAAQGAAPTYALVSSAVRAQATWERLADAAGVSVGPDLSDAAYSASADSALELLRQVPEDASVVAYVGHNPTVSSLALLVDDGDGDPDSFRALTEGLPTAGAAVFAVEQPWSDLAAASGRLLAVHVPEA